jgi:hypothetical protein
MVMTKSPIATPVRAADMGRKEAEEVTQAIKDNFDSLGAMLIQARDRKAYKALGYRSFESYCQTEFGKSVSSAYQLIEDAKVLSQLEAKISENYGEEVTLKFPASHLRPLKAVEDINDKLKVIEYAQQLAAKENRKATKKDLELAVFQVSGRPSEDFRVAIQALGFRRGVQVEVSKSLKKDRGFVTKVDKNGKIYVELNYGGVVPIPYDAADLRILSENEQPVKPLTDDITSKGDRVLIFSPDLKGKEGTIFQWKPGKQALVMVDGQNSPVDIAYAEMELIKNSEKKADWQSELVWKEGKNTYNYSPQHNIIYSDKWPYNLSLQADTRKENPIKFIQDWESEFADGLLNALATPERVKTLVIAQVIELSVEEGREFATDLIDHLQQFIPIPQNDTTTKTALQQENQLLREQLAEAEATIRAMILASTPSPRASEEVGNFLLENAVATASPRVSAEAGDFLLENADATASPADFSVENTSETSNPGDTAAHADFLNDSLVSGKRERVTKILEQERQDLSKTNDEKKRQKIKSNIRYAEEQLNDLDKYTQFKVGDIIIKTRVPDQKGTLTKIEISPTGMPLAWVQWANEYGEPSTPEQHPLRVLKNLSVEEEK